MICCLPFSLVSDHHQQHNKAEFQGAVCGAFTSLGSLVAKAKVPAAPTHVASLRREYTTGVGGIGIL